MLTKTDPSTDKKEPVVIKKYANRRLYNTETSTYVTLDDLADMVRAERDFVVFDAKTGDDLTHSVLTQIIVDQESRSSQSLLPVPFLRQLIRFYGASMEKFVPSYLQLSMDMFTREQDRFRTQFASAFGGGIFDAYQEQARKNIAMFEQAMAMFTPFGVGIAGRREEPADAAEVGPGAPSGAQSGAQHVGQSPGAGSGHASAQTAPAQAAQSTQPPAKQPAAGAKAVASKSDGAKPQVLKADAAKTGTPRSELDELKAELAAMQARLQRMSDRGS